MSARGTIFIHGIQEIQFYILPTIPNAAHPAFTGAVGNPSAPSRQNSLQPVAGSPPGLAGTHPVVGNLPALGSPLVVGNLPAADSPVVGNHPGARTLQTSVAAAGQMGSLAVARNRPGGTQRVGRSSPEEVAAAHRK